VAIRYTKIISYCTPAPYLGRARRFTAWRFRAGRAATRLAWNRQVAQRCIAQSAALFL